MAIGERLREERKRLKMTQAVFAQTGGIGLSALKMYEGNERDPGALFLAALGTAGADVQYVVTGRRSNSALAADEQIVLDSYRALDPRAKREALAYLLTGSGPLAVQKAIKEKSAAAAQSQITVTATGRGAQAAGKKIINRGSNGEQSGG